MVDFESLLEASFNAEGRMETAREGESDDKKCKTFASSLLQSVFFPLYFIARFIIDVPCYKDIDIKCM